MPIFVVNNIPGKLRPLLIKGSVGQGGQNDKNDVMLMQSLLNALPYSAGGPTTALKIDGLCGPLTIAAITAFQKRHTKYHDALISYNGPTLRHLTNLVNANYKFPDQYCVNTPQTQKLQQMINLRDYHKNPNSNNIGYAGGAPSPKLSFGSQVVISQAQAKSNYDTTEISASMPALNPYKYSTNWTLNTVASISASWGFLGVVHGFIYMRQDSQPDLDYKYEFIGEQFGVSKAPGGVDFSEKDQWDKASRIRALSNPRTLLPSDFVTPVAIITGELNLGVGLAASVLFFSNGTAASILSSQNATPNAGINVTFAGIAGFL